TVETRVDWIAATTSELSRTADLVAVAADSRLVTSVGAADPFLVAPTQLERAFVWAPTADEASWTALAGTTRSVEYTSLTGLLIDGFTVALELTGTATDPDLPHCAVELERDGESSALSGRPWGRPVTGHVDRQRFDSHRGGGLATDATSRRAARRAGDDPRSG
ncbi:MAG: hypothetical protein ACYTFV_11520, partial [Planctomycetota bacterium]